MMLLRLADLECKDYIGGMNLRYRTIHRISMDILHYHFNESTWNHPAAEQDLAIKGARSITFMVQVVAASILSQSSLP